MREQLQELLRASGIARRRAEPAWRAAAWTSERADTLFVCEREWKAAAIERQPQRAERALHAKAAEASFPLGATKWADSRCSRRRSAGGDGGTTLFRFVSSDEGGGNPANIAASAASNQTQRDPRAAKN